MIAMLAAILFPVFGRARENARRSSCLSNMKQIGTATIMYAQDYDESIYRGGNTWPISMLPYIKSNQIFVCPSSTAPQPTDRVYTNVVMDNGPQSGTFASNLPPIPFPTSTNLSPAEQLMPLIFGNYARNNEWFVPNAGGARYFRLAAWNAPAQEIFYAESRAGSEDNDNTDWDQDNAPTLEQGGTTWPQMWATISNRHFEGSNVAYADGHVKWHRHDWFKSAEGKIALNWFKRHCPDTENWDSVCATVSEPPF